MVQPIMYLVEVFDEEDEESLQCSGVPREIIIILLVYAQYTTDWHMRNAFQHNISLPDDMVSDAWLTASRKARSSHFSYSHSHTHRFS